MSGTRHARGPSTAPEPQTEYDVVVVGAGFMGLYALYRVRALGLCVKGYEIGAGPGGTWYWNRYPGAQCDIESMEYSYSFDPELEQEWQWPHDFGMQAALESYANHVADRYNIRELVQFETRVTGLRFDQNDNRWHIATDQNDNVIAKYIIAATGSLNATNVPDFAGLESFGGEWHHTSQWPSSGVEMQGKRVGVIGTGSTGIQLIPEVARQAGHLTVFQRTANFSMPSGNRLMDPDYEREYKRNYRHYRAAMRDSPSATLARRELGQSVFAVGTEERERIFTAAWEARSGFKFLRSFSDILSNADANEVAAEFVRGKIREIVDDPTVAELLCPKTHPIGTKRPCLDNGYYEVFSPDGSL